MNHPLDLLILENEPADAELIEWELRKEHISFTARRVETENDFRHELEKSPPDLVLADFHLPTYDGISAIHAVQELSPETPVVIVTGALNEEAAASTLKAGAVDYVVKDKLVRLGPAVRNAVEKRKAVQAKERVEHSLSEAYAELEQRVRERTEELESVNQALRDEVGQRLRVEHDLKKSESLYRTLVESANSAILRWTPEGKVTFINTFGLHFFGYQPHEILGNRVWILFPPSPSAEQDFFGLVSQILHNPEHFEIMEVENIRRSGERVYVSWTNRVLRDENGAITEILSIGNDVTALKMAEEQAAARAREAQEGRRVLEAMMEHIPESITVIDERGRVRFVSQYTSVITGVSVDKVVGLTIEQRARLFDIWTADGSSWPLKEQPLSRAFHQGQVITDEELYIRTPDGLVHPVSVSAGPIVDSEGRIAGAVVTWRDIGKRKEMERELRRERDNAQRYLDIAGVVIVVLDSDGRIVLVNRKGLDLLGCNHEEITGEDWFEFALPSEVRQQVRSSFEAVISGRAECPDMFEHPIVTRSGEIRQIVWHNRLIKGEDGKNSGTLSSGEDITERKRAEENLRISEERMRILIEHSPDEVFQQDASLRYVWLSRMSFPTLSREQVIGKTDFDIFPAEQATRMIAMKRRVLATGKSVRVEIGLGPSDHQRYIDVTYEPWRDATGNVVGVLGYVRDITHSKQIQKQLAREREIAVQRAQEAEEGQRILDALMDNIPEGIAVVDAPSLRLRALSDYARAFVGLPQGDLSSLGVEDFLKGWLSSNEEQQRSFDDLPLIRAMRSGTVISDEEWPSRLADGSSGFISVNAGPITDEHGSITGGIVAWRDITERKKSREQLLKYTRTLRVITDINQVLVHATEEPALLQAICHPLVVTGGYRMAWIGLVEGGAGTIVRPVAWAGHEEGFLSAVSFDYGESELDHNPAGRAIQTEREYISMDINEEPSSVLWRNEALARGYRSCLAVPLTTRERVLGVLMLFSGQPNAFNEDEFQLMDELAKDLAFGIEALRTQQARLRAEEALRRQTEELARANQDLIEKNSELDEMNERLRDMDKLKSEFVSMASHELRTPLTGIIGFSETLLATDIELTPEERDRYLRIIEVEGKRLGALIGQMLDVSRIESGAREMGQMEMDMGKLVQETLASMQMPVGVETRLKRESEDLIMWGDKNRLKQVLTNLLDNAQRYAAPRGSITITLSSAEDTMSVSVHNTGPDIPQKELGRIFDKFYRAKTAPERQSKGSGLGLSIAKGIVEAHGGQIWAESKPGQGSTFHFTLPKRKRRHEQANSDHRRRREPA